MTTVGDKIGLPAPTDQGDNNTWGSVATGLNGVLFPIVDEVFYTEREQRNLVVLGGGKISWDSGTGNVTFTSAIEIYGHIAGFKNSITTAASPITLNAALKAAYVSLVRKPASDQNLTAATVVSNGSLPNGTTDSDMGTFVLAFRTNDSTVIIPWAKRELLSGDFWQFGTALSWYERIASNMKPNYNSNSADSSQVIVPGTASAPSVVNIDGKLYANTSNATLDLDTAGRGGLDTGAKAASTTYYLYAIPAASGRTFDLVCSVTAPTTGPTGFTSWSYLGGFPTVTASAVDEFVTNNGVLLSNAIQSVTVNNASPATSKTVQVPVTAKNVYFRSNWVAVAVAGDDLFVGPTSASTPNRHQATSATASQTAFSIFWVPILTAQTVFANVTTVTTDSANLIIIGWMESPMEYK